MRNVVFVAPFPLETTMRFARAAARLQGVRFLGIAQEPPGGADRQVFADMVRVGDALDTKQLVGAAKELERRYGPIHRVIGILEPLQVQLGQMRDALGIPGTSAKTADLFRDKARMKDELRRHGLPCARHKLIRQWSDAEAFAREVGFPMVVKPPAGMGSKATWRIHNVDELRSACNALSASPTNPCLAEEFLLAREHSFETITIGGQVRFESATRYYPTPLEVMQTPWIQWVVVLPRVIDGDDYADARAVGRKVVAALGLDTGMTHMEWFRRDDGSLAIGEIAARPPGAHIVLGNSYAYDTDMYRAWARATVDGEFDGPWERKYAVGIAYLRGPGSGRVTHIRGVDEANRQVGHLVCHSKLPTVGTPKSESYEGDGFVIVRHPDTEVVKKAMAVVIETIKIDYA